MNAVTKEDDRFLAGLRGPCHWSEREARRALSLLEASGESRAAFARRHGLTPTRLAFWQRRLEAVDDEPVATDAPQWVELVGVEGSGIASRSDVAARVRMGELAIELGVLDEATARFVVALHREVAS
jgi:transposase-like protein